MGLKIVVRLGEVDAAGAVHVVTHGDNAVCRGLVERIGAALGYVGGAYPPVIGSAWTARLQHPGLPEHLRCLVRDGRR
jgi:hypothetical protein